VTIDTDLETLLAEAEEALWCDPPEMASLVPGAQVAWDNCCGGQLWIRVVRIHPVNPNPTKVLEERACGYPLGMQIGIGVVRCQQGVDLMDSDKHPTATQLGEDAARMLRDAGTLLGVLCNAGYIIDQWTPLGPLGACFGGEWTAWPPEVQLPDCGEESR
jgi:hypothetical protein